MDLEALDPLMINALSPRQIEVATAAGDVFLSHGFARTTMGELASAANLSRQGLYLMFSRKEEVFAAALSVLDARLHRDLASRIKGKHDLRTKLDVFIDLWIERVFDLLRRNPDAADMDDLAFPSVRLIYSNKIDLLARWIIDGSPRGITAVEATLLARVMMFSIRGFFVTATDGRDMRRLARLQADLVIGHVESSAHAAEVAA
jgi:AcrR family transcriptional regulator